MGRPETFSTRQPGANLESPVNRRELPLGINPPARVVHRAVIPDPAPESRAAVLHIRVVRHVILELVMLAVLAEQDIPFPGVELVAVEFVPPDKLPAGSRRRLLLSGEPGGQHREKDRDCQRQFAHSSILITYRVCRQPRAQRQLQALRYCLGNFHGARYFGMARRVASGSPRILSVAGSKRIERPSFSESRLSTMGTSTRT